MIRLVALLDLPSAKLALAESLGAPETLEIDLPAGTYRLLLDDWSGDVRIESSSASGSMPDEQLGSVSIEGYSLLVGDAGAINRAADRDGERFWSELFAKIGSSVDGVAAGSFELASGATVAFTGMAEGEHEVRALRDAAGSIGGVIVAG